jgi:D-galactarolactone cycloisomerase
MFVITRIQTYVFRYPLTSRVVTSFGAMNDRPAVIVRVEDADGAYGWGEIWCNFPNCGAEHRARLVDEVIAPRLVRESVEDVPRVFATVERSLRILALQTGEPGPLAQAAAGVDIALCDLAARRAGVPVRKLLNAEAADTVAVYASGIHPDVLEDTVHAARARGFRSYKLKIGFGTEKDMAAVRSLREMLRDGESMMLDANQAWDLGTAAVIVPRLADYRPVWLEEPLPADTPWSEWQSLAQRSTVPLAAGENLRGHDQFDAALASDALGVVQPDICKWGGFSGCLPVARRIVSSGRTYCPHFLGAGTGLMASAQLLAAVGGSGSLEVDSNPNPLRELLGRPLPEVLNGRIHLSDAPGLGVDPDIDGAAEWLAHHTVAA